MRSLSKILLLLPLLFSRGVAAETTIAGGYQEAVFSVSSIERYCDFFEEVAGWQVVTRGALSRAQLDAWGLEADASGREVVLANAGSQRGYVRLVQFSGVEQQQIRSSAQAWDTGGWFDVNSRVLDMAKKFSQFQARDWQSSSDPVEFSFGPFVVKEWLARGPDGIVIAMIERVAPALEGWPGIRELSRIFNATQIVSDMDAARDFYIEKLQFKVYLDHNGASKKPGPNVLGMPYNAADKVARQVSIVHPQGTNEGSIELLAFDGFTGADFSSRAVPPNLGILMLRFPVSDMHAFRAHVEAVGIETAFEPRDIEIQPYGLLRIMAIRGPDGVWLEFFQKI